MNKHWENVKRFAKKPLILTIGTLLAVGMVFLILYNRSHICALCWQATGDVPQLADSNGGPNQQDTTCACERARQDSIKQEKNVHREKYLYTDAALRARLGGVAGGSSQFFMSIDTFRAQMVVITLSILASIVGYAITRANGRIRAFLFFLAFGFSMAMYGMDVFELDIRDRHNMVTQQMAKYLLEFDSSTSAQKDSMFWSTMDGPEATRPWCKIKKLFYPSFPQIFWYIAPSAISLVIGLWTWYTRSYERKLPRLNHKGVSVRMVR